MNPIHISKPEVPSRQCLWQILLRCLQHLGNYWARHLPSDITEPFCIEVDKTIDKIIHTTLYIDVDCVSNVTQERIRLPVRNKGLGLRSLRDRRHAEFIGGVIQGITPLLKCQTENGITREGRLDLQSIKGWLGEHSFEGNEEIEPWAVLQTHEDNSPTFRGIKHSWTFMRLEINRLTNRILPDTVSHVNLLANSLTKAGFNSQCKLIKNSVTKMLTIEIEQTRFQDLEKRIGTVVATSNINPRERLSFLQTDSLSNQFITALPDILGIMKDEILLEAFHQYLGQPSPAMKPFIHQPHYIGRRSRNQVVDKYGDSVARSFLLGGDFIRAHNELETLVKKIFQRAGLQTTMQPLNIFHGKIPGPAMARYNSLHAKEAIIPDILVYNYPLKARSVGHLNGEAIFDIKTVWIDKYGTIYP